jgi:hypothetical protein
MTEFLNDHPDGMNDAYFEADFGSGQDGFVGDIENLGKDVNGDIERAGDTLVDGTLDTVKEAGVDGWHALESAGSDIASGHVVEAAEDLVGGALDSAGDLLIGTGATAIAAGANAIAAVSSVAVDGAEAVGDGLWDGLVGMGTGIDDSLSAIGTGAEDVADAVGDAAEDVVDGIEDLF